jgi:hypothetical protein
MEPELGGYELKSEADVRREAAIKGFNFLRKNRTAANRAEQLGIHLASLTDFQFMYDHPDKVKKYKQTKNGRYLTEEDAAVYRPTNTSSYLTDKYMIAVEPVRLERADIVAVRRKSEYQIAQLVVPEMLTYIGSVASTDEVLASADENGKLFGPYGGELLPLTQEFVESLDAVLTEYSTVLGLPRPGEL